MKPSDIFQPKTSWVHHKCNSYFLSCSFLQRLTYYKLLVSMLDEGPQYIVYYEEIALYVTCTGGARHIYIYVCNDSRVKPTSILKSNKRKRKQKRGSSTHHTIYFFLSVISRQRLI